MSFSFDPDAFLIAVSATVSGPAGLRFLRLALDTEASHTIIVPEIIEGIGYDLAGSSEWTDITTASGVEKAAIIDVEEFGSLGQLRANFSITALELPSSTGLDGLLGLDFLRGHKLTIDFQQGLISLG